MIIPDRRSTNRNDGDRRRSDRWELNRPLRWRVFRGRKMREGWMIERSLEGLVVLTTPANFMEKGTRFYVWEKREVSRLGFRSAVVNRTASPNDHTRVIYAEIEA